MSRRRSQGLSAAAFMAAYSSGPALRIAPRPEIDPTPDRFTAGLCCGDCRSDDECDCRVTEAEDGEVGCLTHHCRA